MNPAHGADIAEAIAVRTQLGLRADAEYVEAVHAAADSVQHEFGVLLTPLEVAELERRFAAQEDLGGLAEYGADHADAFGGMYIDQASGGHVVLLFTRDVELHARLARVLAPPGITLRVRQVDFSEAELVEVIDSLAGELADEPALDMVSASVDVIRNVVTLEVKTNDPSAKRRLEAAHRGRLEVIVHPVPGPWQNADAGDGWRLLAFGEAAGQEASTVRAATDAGAFTGMWAAIGLDGEPPAIDIETEIAVSFGHGIGSTCREVRLDDIVIDDQAVYSAVSDPLSPRTCTTDLVGAAVFVVAVSRSALPPDGFTLRLGERSTTCADCGFIEEIEVSLP